ncbi:LysM peptidoglycan-binding domain-containing protein [Virgibacillus kekensis]|uniref:LysM peptidoglycan-binding domain-containing protein n=1 Tax=Virgibacillus kekensis TaxID=202261 RepID=A0ABV9DK81_9BACI
MKKLLASFVTGVIIAGASLTTASAAEYNVQEGDNLWDIAKEYDTTVDALVRINDLKNTLIHPKQKLLINEKYKVEQGDTLIEISNKYNVPVKALKKWNNLMSDLIVTGQELDIRGANIQQDNSATVTTLSTESSSNVNTSNENSSSEGSDIVVQTDAQSNNSQEDPEGKTVTVTATAYTADCAGCSGVTYTGVDLNANPNAKVIAVDPDVIPLGSKVYVEGYGYATAADIGSAIQGNKIDVHLPTKADAYSWGVRSVDVTIISE